MTNFRLQIISLISGAGIIQGFFTALLLTRKTGKKSRATRFLSILLIVLSLTIAHRNYISFAKAPGDPTIFVLPVFLWFYVLELAGLKVQWSAKTLLHFVPFLIAVLLITILRYIGDHYFQYRISAYIYIGYSIFWAGAVVQYCTYVFYVRKKSALLLSQTQNELAELTHSGVAWVNTFITGFITLIVFLLLILLIAQNLTTTHIINELITMLLSCAVFILSYEGLIQVEINAPADNLTRILKSADQEQMSRLLTFMNEQRPYLDADLTLSSLAESMGMSRTNLSSLINTGAEENFYNFINAYRVEEVKLLMIDPSMKNFNLFGLASAAGFKSKSTFNLFFKRYTGLTPTEYIKQHQNLKAK